MPFREPFNQYYEEIIRPAAADAGLDALRADSIYGTRAIIRDVWEQIWRARVVIADVTDKNPNVNYELGICHTLGVPTILVTRRMEDVPFDYRHRRCIVYNTEEVRWDQKLRESLRKTIEAVLGGHKDEDELPWPYDTLKASQPSTVASLLAAGNPRELVMHGTQAVRRIVAKAFGPAGTSYSVSIDNQEARPYKQGSKIVQGIRPINPLERRGVKQMQWIVQEVSDAVGDGTKTGVLLGQEMMERGSELLDRGFQHIDVIRGMRMAVDKAIEELARRARAVRDEDVRKVAATAAMSDEIGALVAEAFEKVGKYGVVTVEQSRLPETVLEVIEGMEFDQGYLSPYFMTNPTTSEVVLENPLILVHERRISSARSFLPLLEEVAKRGTPLLIIAEDIEGEALSTLVVNKLRGTLDVAAVRAPRAGDRRKATLEDIAILTGSRVISEDLGIRLEQVGISDLGTAKQVRITSESTTIIEGGGKTSAIEGRVRAMRAQIEETTSPFSRQVIQERLAKMVGGVAVIRVGGASDIDISEKSYRCISALHSARSALEEGWVSGGGLTLYRLSKLLGELAAKDKAEAAGIGVIEKALESPIVHLIENIQISATSAIHEINQARDEAIGFNVNSKRVEDLTNAGVIDSVKMLRVALEIAFSYSKSVLETNEWDLEEPGAPSVDESIH
jgi:chaperonin GroEL